MSSFLLKGTFYGEVMKLNFSEIKSVMENVTNLTTVMQKYIPNT